MFFYNEPDSEGGQIQTIAEDPYFYNTSLLLNMDSDFSDSSVNNHTVTVNGNASINTTESKFGAGSGYFDGSGDYLTVGTTSDTNSGGAFAIGDKYTIELWAYYYDLSGEQTIIENFSGASGPGWTFFKGAPGDSRNIAMYINGVTVSSNSTVSQNTWHHIAFTRDGTNAYLFLDGNLIGSSTALGTAESYQGNYPLHIGERNSGDGRSFASKAYFDDLRITKGVARYTTNFTPPTEAHPTTGPSEIVSDQLTFHLDSSNINSYPGSGTTWTSLVNSSDVGTFVGDPTFNSVEADSIDLDGNGDYIQIDNTSLFDFSGDFTVEMTMKLDQIGQTNGATVILSNNILDNFQISANVDGNSMNVNIGGSRISSPAYSSSVVGRWSTFTMSRISGVIYFYDNANLMGTVNNSTNIDSSALYLGVQTPSRVPFLAHFTDGKIGSFRVYNKGLSSQEVLQNFHATKDRFGL